MDRSPIAKLVLCTWMILVSLVSWYVINEGEIFPSIQIVTRNRVHPPTDFRDPPLSQEHLEFTWNRGIESPPPPHKVQEHPCGSFHTPSVCRLCKCPVCYLPVDQALESYPPQEIFPELVLSRLTYLRRNSSAVAFGGSPSLEERRKSFEIRKSMEVPCGFARAGAEPGEAGSGFEIQNEADKAYLKECGGIAVVSAIFGNYDRLKAPTNLSNSSLVCFVMFVDDATLTALKSRKRKKVKPGVWRIIHVRSDAYKDNRSIGEIPKMLLHRLLPNARFSIWIDGKLQLVADPIQILERFLWRSNDTMAISNHYDRSDAYEEAKATILYKRYNNKTKMDEQMEFYRRHDGLVPYDGSVKMPLVSDVPESCSIIREHTAMTNLFSCLWFNELDRFTPRDQVSFAVVRDKVIAQVPWRINMFRDCERRNYVRERPHK